MIYMDRRLFQILDHINEGIIIIDEKLNIIYWNTQMEKLTNIKQEKAINRNLYERLPSLDRNYFRNAIDSVVKKRL